MSYKKEHFAWREQISIQFGKESSTFYVANQKILSTMKIKEKIVLFKSTGSYESTIPTNNNLKSK